MKQIVTKTLKVSYDEEADIFFVRGKGTHDVSMDIGKFIFDLDKKKRIIGIEVLDATKIFNIPRSFLENMVSVEVGIEVKPQVIHVSLKIASGMGGKKKVKTCDIRQERYDFLQPIDVVMASS